MPPEELKNLQKLIKMFSSTTITTEEFQSAISDIVNAFAQHRSAFKEMSTQSQETMNTSLKNLQSEFDKMRADMDSGMTMTKSEMDTAMKKMMADCKAMCDEMMAMKPMDGVSPDPKEIVTEVLKEIKLPENKVITADEVRDNLETLEGDERLDASAIKNLPEATKTIIERISPGGIGSQPVKVENIWMKQGASGEPVIYIPVQATAPTNPKVNQLWYDIS